MDKHSDCNSQPGCSSSIVELDVHVALCGHVEFSIHDFSGFGRELEIVLKFYFRFRRERHDLKNERFNELLGSK